MKIRRLKLVNFRQHGDTDIDFGDGITGVIGPNGSGKTTLLEAIGWAIYGTTAARGDKESIRNLRAKPRASVRVELEFELGRHAYRVARGLHGAELYEDGRVLANAPREVTERLERSLGMSHDEFFNTYFTGQKQLAVMARQRGPTDRAAFLSQVLGYERLRLAQERVREEKKALGSELRGLEAGLPDRAALEAERAASGARLAAARAAARAADAVRADARSALEREEPRWKEWQAREKRALSLGGERGMAEQAVVTARQEHQRLDRELAEALQARERLRQLEPELAPIEALKRELVELERLQREEAARRAEAAQLEELRRAAETLERRLAELAPALEALPAVEREAGAIEARLQVAERMLEQERTAWEREKQYAETKRAELRTQYRDVKQERDRIVELGPEGTCPTCRRPLGPEYGAVLELLDNQLRAIVENGDYFRKRVDQLVEAPDKVRIAEAARDALLDEGRRMSERAGALRAQAEERSRAMGERVGALDRSAAIARRLAARPAGYDGARHDAVRGALAKAEPVALEAAALQARAERAVALVRDAATADEALSGRERRLREIEAAIAADGFSDEQFRAARERHERALGALRAAELTVVEARGDLTRGEEDVRSVERRLAERAARERRIAEMKLRQRLHAELDDAFGDLRAELNAEMRPEIAELASGFLADLSDGRYDTLELTEDYEIAVLDDGFAKPVLSGGEEDVANLALRLAISQMIAERAGQPLSLLVLDEIFGALDESRRQDVLGLLRRLADRFPQVILITHVEQVREGLDRVLRVEYDAGRGTSVVRDDTATLGGRSGGGEGEADAGVAA